MNIGTHAKKRYDVLMCIKNNMKRLRDKVRKTNYYSFSFFCFLERSAITK